MFFGFAMQNGFGAADPLKTNIYRSVSFDVACNIRATIQSETRNQSSDSINVQLLRRLQLDKK